MIEIIVTFKDGTVDSSWATLDYALHVLGQWLIDPAVAHVHLTKNANG